MTPYHHLVAEYERLVREGKKLPMANLPITPRPKPPANAPRALFFAPHPDDETIVGGFALRLAREAQMNVVNVVVTQGSKKERQAARFGELQKACQYLGYEVIATGPNGLEKIHPRTRQQEPQYWAGCVKTIAHILANNQPQVILFPHEHDWNSTHIGTHFLIMDALKSLPAAFETYLVETEFWGQMDTPNLMVEISAANLGDMIAATTFHIGEIKRNPYHLLLPAWMMDNVRRGAELVGGQGGAPPDFTFAALYRLRRWTAGAVSEVLTRGKNVPAEMNVGELFTLRP